MSAELLLDKSEVWGLAVGFFCSSVQLSVLSSPCLCLISFLCLGLYVLRDDTSISQGHSCQSGIYLFWSASEVGDEVVAVGMFGPPGGFLADRSGAVLLFMDPFLLFVFVCHTVLSAPC